MKRFFTPLLSLLFISWIAQAQPTTQASNIVISPVSGSTTSIRFDWTAGNGANRIVVIKDATGVFTPSNNTTYTANTAFGSGSDLDAGGGVVKSVLNGTATTVTVTGLTADTEYTVQVYEYSGSAGAETYNTGGAANNPVTLRYYTATGTWTKPTGISNATAQTWGGGGSGGGNDTNADGGGGGGGGAYSSALVDVTGSGSFTVTVGAGGSGATGSDGNNGENSSFSTVIAEGGKKGLKPQSGNGGVFGVSGLAANSVGTAKFDGGDGGTGQNDNSGLGGPGGSSGGITANGTDGPTVWSSATASAGPTGSGFGGNGGAANTSGSAGNFPGGGGGGSGDGQTANRAGGAGANGLVIVSYTRPMAVIVRQTPTSQNTNAVSVTFRVTFSENVNNVSADGSDFQLALTGTAAGTISTVNTITASTVFDVVVTGVSGNGNLTLGFAGGQNIVSASTANTFSGTAISSQFYTIDNIAPVLTLTVPSTSSFRNNANVTYTLTESLASGTITWTRTGGTVDGSSPHTKTLSGVELTANQTNYGTGLTLVNGTIYDVAFAGTDLAGNPAITVTNTSVTFDTSVPTVSNVMSSTGDGTYGIGQAVNVTVNFSENVTVTGTPRIQLETGSTDRQVDYVSGSGTSAWVFTYTVQATDVSADLDYLNTGALTLNGGTIKDAAGNDATLTLATPGAANSISDNQAIVIDGVQPTVSNVTATTANGTYSTGQTVDVTIQFSAAVNVTGTPQLTLETGTTDRTANYASGTGTNTLTFTYTAVAGDASSDLDYTNTGALGLNGGTIKSTSGNDAILTLVSPGAANSLGANKAIVINTAQPVVTGVSATTSNGSYRAGQTVAVTVTFDKVVIVIGTPQIQLETGATDRLVDYTSGSLSTTLTFTYTIQAGDVSSDLDYVSTSALTLNGGTIKDTGTNDATLTLATPGAANSLGANKNIIIDTANPTVSTVSSTTANGSYRAGQTVVVTVQFNEVVTVTGTPQIQLETGATDRLADYASGTGTNTLSFNYVIQAGDISSDLDYLATNSLGLNSGTIKDAAGNDATLTLASPTAANSLGANKDLIIDTAVPTVSNVMSTTGDGTYSIGQAVNVTVNFNENVTITGTPQIQLETGATDRQVNYISGSGTSALVFTYTVQAGDAAADLDYLNTGALTLNGGTIKDAAGNDATLTLAAPGAANSISDNQAIVIDGIQPTVTNVTSAKTDGLYTVGEVINITIQFSSNVNVTGTPQLTLETGATDRTANYSSGTGTNTLTFTYTVQTGDITSDLDYTGTNSLGLNGGTIKSTTGNDATLTLVAPAAAGSLGANKALVIDAQAPTVTSVSSSTTNGSYRATQSIVVTVTFSEAVTVTGMPRILLETGGTDRNADYTSGTGTTTLSFTYTIQAGDVSADLDYNSTGALTLNAGTIKDAATNDAILTLATPGAANSLGANKAIIIDTTPPSTPGAPNLADASDSGTSNTDNITNAASPVFAVTGTTSGDLIEILSSVNGVVGSLTATGTTTNVTATVAMTQGNGQAHTITARATDAAGNVSTVSTGLGITYDQTAPTVTGASMETDLTASNDASFTSCNGTTRNNTSSTEFVHVTFSENLGISNGQFVKTEDTTPNTSGWTASAGTFDVACDDRGSSVFHNTNVIHLKNTNNGDWSGTTTFGYKNSATTNLFITVTNNYYYVRDVAGNELGDVPTSGVGSILPGDTNPPKPESGLVFNPGGSGVETIVFILSEALVGTVGSTLTGFSIDGKPGTINAALTNYNSATRTVTLTSTNHGDWNDTDKVSYDAGTGNVTDPGLNELSLTSEPIYFKSVGISSTNATNTAYAKTGNTVSLAFTSSKTLTGSPAVKINGRTATAGGVAPNYVYTLSNFTGFSNGIFTIRIAGIDAASADSTVVTLTTNNLSSAGSTMTLDNTAPTVVLTDDHPDAIVRDADAVIITATFTETNTPIANPTISISQVSPTITNAAMTATGNPLVWTYTWDVPSGATNDGARTVTISAKDQADNASTAATGQTSYTIDNTAPTVTSIVVDPAMINSYAATVNGITPSLQGNQVDYIITFNEVVSGVDPNFSDFGGDKFPNTLSTINISPNGSPVPSGGSPASIWTLTADYLSGAGTFRVNFDPSSNTVSAPLIGGTGTIQAIDGNMQVNDAGGTNFPGQIFSNMDIYTNTGQYIGTVNCCITAAKFNLQNPAVVLGGGTFTGSFLYDPTPTSLGSRPGTITASTVSNTVTGLSTNFLINLQEGDLLFAGGGGQFIGQVQTITSNTSLQLTSNSNINWTSSSYSARRPSQASYATQIVDVAGNPVSTTYLAGTYGNFALPQPATGVAALTASSTGTSITVTWADLSDADHYLVMLKDGTGTFSTVADGSYFADDASLADGLLRQNINQGIQSATFTGLTAGTAYEAIIYAYTLNDNCIVGVDRTAIDYNTTPARISLNSDIVQTFNYAGNDNIPYNTFQENTNIVVSATSKVLEEFSLRDGGGSADADALPTTLTGITIEITNWQNLRRLALYDGSTELQELDVVSGSTLTVTGVTTGTMSFNSFGSTFQAADGTTPKVLTLRGSFQSTVDDNEIITFRIISVTAPATGSSQFIDTTPTTVVSTATVDQNKIEVTATQLVFTNPAAVTSASLGAAFNPGGSPIQLAARDANSNLDADYVGIIRTTTNATSATMIGTGGIAIGTAGSGVTFGTTTFSGGLFSFPTAFQYSTGNNNDNVTLTLTAGAAGACNGTTILCGTSSTITLLASSESFLTGDPSFIISNPNRIPYILFQENLNLTALNSYELSRGLLVDGSRSAGYVYNGSPLTASNTSTDLTAIGDDDGATTQLTGVTVRIYKPSTIRRIALYSGNTEISGTEVDVTANGAITSATAFYDFVWSGSPILSAPDNSEVPLSIRASFRNSSPNLDDEDVIQVQLTAASVGSGSQFFVSGGYIGGQPPQTPGTVGQIDVVATRLDFIKQPGNFAGMEQLVDTTGIVHARDANLLMDTEVDGVATVNATALPYHYNTPNVFIFIDGILLMDSLRYQSYGDGALTVQMNTLSSATSPIPCETVDVIHVETTLNINGVSDKENLNAGNSDQVILGFTLDPRHYTASHPYLHEFRISFVDKNYQTISWQDAYSAPKIRLSTSTSPNASSSTILSSSEVTITPGQSPQHVANGSPGNDMMIVTFDPTTYPELFDPTNTPVTIYLTVDVNVDVSNGTSPLRARLQKYFNDPYTEDNLTISFGSTYSSIDGELYAFASTKPPAIVRSNPYNGQLNVNPNLNLLTLVFDVDVTTFDGYALLYDKSTNTLIDTIWAVGNNVYVNTTANGVIPDLSSMVNDSVQFDLSGVTLIPDNLYYITIANGKFNINDHSDRAGISDKNFNTFGGISYSGTLYFKISSATPPDMISTATNQYFYGGSSVVFNASFDKYGKAYYLVLNSGAAAPSMPQIKGTVAYSGSVYQGSFDINQTYPNFNYATINAALHSDQYPPTTFTNKVYDVWMYGENDAQPVPIPTSAAYGPQPNFDPNGTVKTLSLTVPWWSFFNTSRFPTYQICSGSSALLAEPIILTENYQYDFLTNTYQRDTAAFSDLSQQSLTLVLPTGYLFDLTKTPNVVLTGSDFQGIAPQVTFYNNTILQIKFTNTSNLSYDNIHISDMYVIASTPGLAGGQVQVFPGGLGSGWDDVLPFNRTVATLNSVASSEVAFTNSYALDSLNNFSEAPISITGTVTYIPDNYFSTELNGNKVRLIPQPDAGDYGPSDFSGNGLINDLLNLTSVPLNTAFNLSLIHTDMNGCKSTTTEQYYVYDHTKAIEALGTEACIVNNNFPAPATNPIILSDSVSRNGLAGFKLLELVAHVNSKGTDPFDAIILDTDQYLYGDNWDAVVQQIPVLYDTLIEANGDTTKTYNWNYDTLLNASYAGLGLPDPYTYFIERDRNGDPLLTPIRQDTIYRGGSLGTIEFVGKYRSTADFTVVAPFRQEVEIFVPAVPVVEAQFESFVEVDTLIYCEKGAPITISGYPLASGGTSTGSFVIRDYYSQSAIAATPAMFIDNGNGTATLYPQNLMNSLPNAAKYKTIQVDYTFQENGSPCQSTGKMYLRITPNPIARFNAVSQPYNANPLADGSPSAQQAYCKDNTITFYNSANWPNGATGYTASTAPIWTMGDPTKGDNTKGDDNLTPAVENVDSVEFIYDNSARYVVTFQVSSQYGCPSQVFSDSIYIGNLPTAQFSMNGISTLTPINVQNNSNVANGSNVTSAIDPLATQWSYTPSGAFTSLSSNLYTTPGRDTITLLTITTITETEGTPTTLPGCSRTTTREVIIVPGIDSVAVGAQFTDYFENSDPLVQWQTAGTIKGSLGQDSVGSSWERDISTKTNLLSNELAQGQNVWVTGASANYNKGEVSYLYSSAYDIHKLLRPMIGFSNRTYFDQTVSGNDGIAIDFSTDTFNVADPEKKWYRLGKQGEGKEWYNRQGLASKPGSQIQYKQITSSGDYGWSSESGKWVKSLHSLSPEVPAYPEAREHVIFRFALSSVGNGDEGIAIDSFRIGERTRVILVENFSNLGRPVTSDEKVQSNYLQRNFDGGAVVGRDYVKLVYHVDFPQVDPFNLDNPADPSARALYYGVGSTPYARLDGIDGSKFKVVLDNKFSLWGKDGFDDRTLELAKAKLTFIEADTTIDGAYKAQVKVSAISPLPTSTILHVVLAERKVIFGGLSAAQQNMIKTGEQLPTDSIHSFEYVVKKMLPSASGTRFTVPLDGDPTTTVDSIFTFPLMEWTQNPDTRYANADDMVIIAFLQDEVSREVHQAIMSPALPDPPLITDTEDPEYAKKINFFPNPANQEVNIVLPYEVTKTTPVIMLDAYGKAVYENYFSPGQKRKSVNTTEMAAGMYVIQITTPDGGVATRKIMVVH